MSVAIVAHTARAAQAARLQQEVGGVVFLDDGTLGAAGNHHRALTWAATQPGRVWIIEDDAQPVQDFHRLAGMWGTMFPGHLISGYLGTGHPQQWMTQVEAQWGSDEAYVHLPQLIHGVCYSLPTGRVPQVLASIDTTRPADYGIGEAWHRTTRLPVIYPKASLVDHADGDPVETTPRTRRGPRKARALAG